MMRSAHRLLPALGLFCTAVPLYAPAVRAEDASATETAAARALAIDGLKLAQANNCAEALPKLERAEKLYHSAVVAGRLGECYISVGRLVEGTEVLRKVLREQQPGDASPALTKALDRAQKTLDAATPRIAFLTIRIVAVQDMRVKLDGNVVPSALLDGEVPADPGEHSIEVTAPGFLKSASRLSVSEGEKRSVSLTLARDPNAIVAAPPVPAAPISGPGPVAASRPTGPAPVTSAPRAASASPPNRTAAYASLGFGIAGVAAGGVLGYLTLTKKSSLQEQCPGNVCSQNQQSDLDSARRMGTLSTIAFGVGGVGLVLGTVLFVTAAPKREEQARATPKPRFAGLSQPRVAMGPTHIELSADF